VDKIKQLLSGPDYIGGMVPGPTIKGQVKLIIVLLLIFTIVPLCCIGMSAVTGIEMYLADDNIINTTEKIEIMSEDITCFDLGWLSVDGAKDMCMRIIDGTEYVKPLVEIIAEHNRASSGE